MVGVFVPLYFLGKGMPLPLMLLQYYGVMYLTSMVANFITVRLMPVIGLKHTIAASAPFLMLQLVLLNVYDTSPVNPSVIAALGGVALSLYWMGLHTDFSLSTDKRKEGAESGVLFSAVRAAAIFGPLLGGLILTTYGFPALFLSALTLVALSTLPLLATKDVKKPEIVSWSSYATTENMRYAIRFFVDGFRAVIEGILWPVFIFAVLGDFFGVGVAGSLAIVGSIFFSNYLGRITDRIGTTKVLRITAVPLAAFYYLLPLARTEFLVLAASLAMGIVALGADLPVYRSFIRHAKENDVVGYTLFRETLMNMGKLTCLIVVALAADTLGFGFYLASLLSVLLVL
ncbi:MAG: hypothetical protein HYS81_01380 [Candidatus Aenigmatarchaeota archaeon]|nr:MAG: hypothetical protein HYS81_01380 [Candidatus Aenigmarchaeota archaeon]